ncbi:MAG: 50S ribosomal protein L28, partial [Firmicutes bacterium HGW-Firmicutes-3]
NAVSHSHRRSNKQWKPNIRSVKAVINGQSQRIKVCSKCLRAGKIVRA